MKKMTLEDIKAMGKEWLTPAEVAPLLGCDPQKIRVQAAIAPQMLGFATCRVGNRTRIPRLQFLRWMEGEQPSAHQYGPQDNPAIR